MNESGVIDAVWTVIDAAKDTLVSDITHQGSPREIQEILTSVITPPKGAYSVTINCGRATEFTDGKVNIVQGKATAVYEMELHINDIPFPQMSDTEQSPYETMHNDFRKLVNRIVLLIRDTTQWFPDASSRPRFRLAQARLQDRMIAVDNRTTWYNGDNGPYPVLYSVIRFTLEEKCVNTAVLYS